MKRRDLTRTPQARERAAQRRGRAVVRALKGAAALAVLSAASGCGTPLPAIHGHAYRVLPGPVERSTAP